MKILLTGATGLIGSRFEELMFENHEITPLSSSNGVDITDRSSIEDFLEEKSFDAVIHLAAKTDVDKCELDKIDDLRLMNIDEENSKRLDPNKIDISSWKEEGSAFAINTVGTKNLYDVAKERNAKFVYISTDFVFSGQEEFYDEESVPNPVDWYGMTKFYGEKLINTTEDLILRLSYPYGYLSPVKKDLVWKMVDLLQEKEEVGLVSDQVITPTFIDDIVLGIDFLLGKQVSGIYHMTGSSFLTPKEMGEKIKSEFGFSTKINNVTLEDLYRGRAPRPFQSRMKNDKLEHLGFKPKTFDEGLSLINI